MAKNNGRAALMDAIEGAEPMDAAKAQEAIDADKQRRAKEYGDILIREGQRLKCDLVAVAEIVGNQVGTKVVVVPK